ncbi:MAG TPA: DUF5320 domain-containing protein [Tenuifilaceae bacterium]|nr:DUF5320 domain-containing protein [Tenuifilaceae bacterium]HPQ33183.1 DUF5320 domain-containing protein [Tenuifilaceae bacterium]HRX68411.1 DUF5320 domain-containing protein [Tenuifilaceae bacterium]
MPGFDQRGPEGQGPMTGRRMGRCTNFGAGRKSQPEGESSSVNPNENLPENSGRGFGFGRGARGRGRGRARGMGLQNRFRGGF